MRTIGAYRRERRNTTLQRAMTNHSHEDALDERTFDELLSIADELQEPYRTETRFILTAGGRLGLRAGEIAHFRREWVDWQKKQIRIPSFDPCDKGRGGGPCGYCYKRAREAAEIHDVTVEDAVKRRWQPKTEHAARAIPFDFAEWIVDELEAFLWKFDRYEHSRVSVNRRMDRLAEAAGVPADDIYPHCLRATAATYHAYRGLPPAALQSLFGWSKLSVANKYVRLSGGATADALRDVHQD